MDGGCGKPSHSRGTKAMAKPVRCLDMYGGSHRNGETTEHIYSQTAARP